MQEQPTHGMYHDKPHNERTETDWKCDNELMHPLPDVSLQKAPDGTIFSPPSANAITHTTALTC